MSKLIDYLSSYAWIIFAINFLEGKSCDKCYFCTSCKCPYRADCTNLCSFSFCKFLQRKIFSTRHYNYFSIDQFRKCLLHLVLYEIKIRWWFRMFKLLLNTQLVNCSPNYWHLIDLFEAGSALAWKDPSRKISSDLFGTYIYYFSF